MTASLVIIRPEPGASNTADLAASQGWKVLKAPLFAVRPVAWSLPDPAPYDALVIGSANAVRHGGENLEKIAHLPVYAVGRTTAAVAQEHGFDIAHTGSGGLSELRPVLEQDGFGRILWLSGRDHVPMPPHELPVDRITVYSSDALDMGADLRQRLAEPCVILLHSARAVEHFRGQCAENGIDISRLSLACFGPRVAHAAGSGWARISTAKKHSDQALLETAGQLCKL